MKRRSSASYGVLQGRVLRYPAKNLRNSSDSPQIGSSICSKRLAICGSESNQMLGVLGRQRRRLSSAKAWVPAAERTGQITVEHVGPDLQEQMRAARRPSHLLLLDRALGDELIDRGFDEAGRDPFLAPIALAVV